MGWEGERKDLVDYAKKPDAGMGKVSVGKWKGDSYSSGVGVPTTQTDGQTPGVKKNP